MAMAIMLGKAERRMWRSVFLWSVAAFLAGNLLLTALFHITDAKQGDRREMLSIPIQQLARTGVGILSDTSSGSCCAASVYLSYNDNISVFDAYVHGEIHCPERGPLVNIV